jgi:hypothetical protein
MQLGVGAAQLSEDVQPKLVQTMVANLLAFRRSCEATGSVS